MQKNGRGDRVCPGRHHMCTLGASSNMSDIENLGVTPNRRNVRSHARLLEREALYGALYGAPSENYKKKHRLVGPF